MPPLLGLCCFIVTGLVAVVVSYKVACVILGYFSDEKG